MITNNLFTWQKFLIKAPKGSASWNIFIYKDKSSKSYKKNYHL